MRFQIVLGVTEVNLKDKDAAEYKAAFGVFHTLIFTLKRIGRGSYDLSIENRFGDHSMSQSVGGLNGDRHRLTSGKTLVMSNFNPVNYTMDITIEK